MDLIRHKKHAVRGFLDDQFLIAMPGMKDDRFARSVIYICAHSEEGAMGLIINQAQQMQFPDLLVQLGIMNEQEAIRLPRKARDFVVRNGGPVDRSRGFVLHSGDYTVESSLPVSDDICLTCCAPSRPVAARVMLSWRSAIRAGVRGSWKPRLRKMAG